MVKQLLQWSPDGTHLLLQTWARGTTSEPAIELACDPHVNEHRIDRFLFGRTRMRTGQYRNGGLWRWSRDMLATAGDPITVQQVTTDRYGLIRSFSVPSARTQLRSRPTARVLHPRKSK